MKYLNDDKIKLMASSYSSCMKKKILINIYDASSSYFSEKLLDINLNTKSIARKLITESLSLFYHQIYSQTRR